MKNYTFWGKASNYSIFVCGIVLIAKMFFRKYLENIILPLLVVGGISLLIFLLSELMKFIIKKKR